MNAASGIILELNIEKLQLPVDASIPLGLIVTEMTTNAVKYAFPEGRNSRISVSLTSLDNGESRVLVFRDNGIGIPAECNPRQSTSLGLNLIYALTGQLRGSITLDRNNGTGYTIVF